MHRTSALANFVENVLKVEILNTKIASQLLYFIFMPGNYFTLFKRIPRPLVGVKKMKATQPKN